MKITVDLALSGISKDELNSVSLRKKIADSHKKIRSRNGTFENAWVELPTSITPQEIEKINIKAEWIRRNCDVLLVVGVGGSYLGAYAGLQLLGGSFPIEFLGTSFDPEPLLNFINNYRDKRVCVNIVSKSGTTMEIMAAFNVIDAFMRMKYPKEKDYNDRMIFTTDEKKGHLRELAAQKNITTFTVPDRVGGRYSVLSSVGLFPFAAAGLDITEIISGAKQAYTDLGTDSATNEAYKYAAARYLMNTQNKKSVEVLAGFHEKMSGIANWWQQLFGESEGKDGKGLFVSSMIFTRDLHSMGQYIQQGKPLLFETIINVEKPPVDLTLSTGSSKATQAPAKSMNALNKAAYQGTIKAHSDAGVPVIIITAEKIDCQSFGYLIYFFEIACAMSAYLISVNPFDQPGVEFYKKNMKDLLH